jgi:tetratricopeptide (TPR) repeat protein
MTDFSLSRRFCRFGPHRIAAVILAILVGLTSLPRSLLGSPTTSTPASQAASQPAQVIARPASQSAVAKLSAPLVTPFHTAVEQAKTPEDKASAYVALAQDILVSRCAPGLSALVCCPDASNTELSVLVDEALAAAQSAGKLADGKDVSPDAQLSIKERAELLDTFGKLFRAMTNSSMEAALSRDALLDACGDLAGYFDDPNDAVVESAKFWQGAAYRRAGRADRALAVLRPAIAAPEARRLGLLGRLQRCLALGDKQNYDAAIALCLKLEARVDAWFEDESPAEQKKAQDSARWVRITLLRGWSEQLKKAGEAKHANELIAEADKLLAGDPYPPPPERWLGFSATIEGLGEWKLNPTPPTTSQAGS